MKRRHPNTLLSTLVTALVAALTALAVPVVAHAQPASAPNGWVRLGHLSPKTPPVDIYLAPFGQAEKVAFRKAGYGAVTPYSPLAPGAYTVSMRPADAPASSAPALSANVDVKQGVAYTALVFENGPNGSIKPTLLTDDLTAPPAGSGKVRVVEAATEKAPVEVAIVGGPTLATGLNYGDTSQYTSVPEGRWNVSIKEGSNVTETNLDVRSGSVNTLVVTDTPGVGLKLTPLRDSAGSSQAPSGGIATGAGGTAPGPPFAVLLALLVGALAGAFTVLVLRRRSRA